jgi:hypothetical protein
VDDVRLWNVVRSSGEIASAFRTELNGPQQGMMANWHFDDSSGASAGDNSGNHRDAVLNGGAAYSTEVPR